MNLPGYEKAEAAQEIGQLQPGGYVLKILDIKIQNYDWGDVMVLLFDIEEGEQKEYFKKNYENQTGENKKWKGAYRWNIPNPNGNYYNQQLARFKGTMEHAIEASNKGYKFDLNTETLKGKMVGGIFGLEPYEIDGRSGHYTKCMRLTSVEKIRKNDFEIPQPKEKKAETNGTTSNGFMNSPDGVDEALPFN